jgi:phospholipid/cholesterol/gamma-HCH transport system substrate-binding protein
VTREALTRLVAIGALVVAVAAVLIIVLAGGSSYVVNARFTDEGQLVSGDYVTIGGHDVGTVGAITIAPNGLANVQLDLDSSVGALHRDTTAQIGEVSQTTEADLFVTLYPGASGPTIPSGGVLPVSQTRGIVDPDVLLDALTPKVRNSIVSLLKSGAYLVRQPTQTQLARLILYLDPAFNQLARFGGEIVTDRYALQQLIASSATVSQALAARDSQLAGAVSETSAALGEIASQRSALQDEIVRSPAVLGQTDRVFARLDTTLVHVDPALAALRPVAPRLATLLRRIVPLTQNLTPAIERIQALLPQAKAALQTFPAVEAKDVPALRALTSALRAVTPIVSGLRAYVPDFITGFFNGNGGTTGAEYDANGQFLHTRLLLQGGSSSLSGLLTLLGGSSSALGTLGGGNFTTTEPCPGGGSPPSADGSAPWTNPDAYSSVAPLCDPADDQKP